MEERKCVRLLGEGARAFGWGISQRLRLWARDRGSWGAVADTGVAVAGGVPDENSARGARRGCCTVAFSLSSSSFLFSGESGKSQMLRGSPCLTVQVALLRLSAGKKRVTVPEPPDGCALFP